MHFRCFPIFLLALLYSSLLAQTKVVTDTEVWPQYYFNFPVNPKFSVALDYSHRYSDFFDSKTQWIGRFGLNYKLNKSLSIAGGFAYSEYFTKAGVRMENRPWQQIQLLRPAGKANITQRLRLEERFQKENSSNRFNYRLRYTMQAVFPLLKENKLAIALSDEPMLNLGRQISGNRFDQNRLQAGLQIKVAKNIFLTPSYLYIYQFQPSKQSYRNINVWRTGISYNLNGN